MKFTTLLFVVSSLTLPLSVQEADAMNARRTVTNSDQHNADKKAGLKIIVKPGDWAGGRPVDIKAVLKSSAHEIWKHMDSGSVKPIYATQSKHGPLVAFERTKDGGHTVLLSCSGTFWSQYAYQFAHEFCHILANYRSEKNPNKWFEETICETASLFSLGSMAETWKTDAPYDSWRGYNTSLKTYIDGAASKSVLPANESFVKWFKANEPALRNNEYLRDKNMLMANKILPMLNSQPSYWNAVRYMNIGKPSKTQSFQAYLKDWHMATPAKHRGFVKEIAKLYHIELD